MIGSDVAADVAVANLFGVVVTDSCRAAQAECLRAAATRSQQVVVTHGPVFAIVDQQHAIHLRHGEAMVLAFGEPIRVAGRGHEDDVHRFAIRMLVLGKDQAPPRLPPASTCRPPVIIRAPKLKPTSEICVSAGIWSNSQAEVPTSRLGPGCLLANVFQQSANLRRWPRVNHEANLRRVAAVQDDLAIQHQAFVFRVARRDLIAVDENDRRHRRIERQESCPNRTTANGDGRPRRRLA